MGAPTSSGGFKGGFLGLFFGFTGEFLSDFKVLLFLEIKLLVNLFCEPSLEFLLIFFGFSIS